MPFGVTNTPVVFQRFINEVLGNLLDVCMVGYIDDILIYSDSTDQHWDQVQEVLRRLQEAGLYMNPNKCNFHTDTVEYLGFILTPTGLHIDRQRYLLSSTGRHHEMSVTCNHSWDSQTYTTP